jgi:uncharacterized protein involved in exopolysaccharide biosynthesis
MNVIEEVQMNQRLDDEIDFLGLAQVVWRGKWYIGGVTFVAALLAVFVMLLIPNQYTAQALLAPRDDQSGGGLAGLASQYGGLASLAGISIPSGSNDKVDLGIQVLKSRKFITGFIERHDILVPLLAAEKWDRESDQLIIDEDDYDTSENKWVRSVRPPKKTIPSLLEAYEEFMERLQVVRDKKDGFVTVSFTHHSPSLASQWVEWLVADVNSIVMRQDVLEAEQAIEYLNKQVAETSLAEMRTVFFRLIEEQMKTVLLAEVSKEYVLKTVDPAVAPEKKTSPRRTLIVLLSATLAFSISVIVALILSSYLGNRRA